MKDKIELSQISIYIATIIGAIFLGLNVKNIHQINDYLPITLAVLMYSMFLQLPFAQLKESLSHRKFIIALLLSNYIVVPIVVAILIQFLPNESTVVFAVLLVLLTPCIDYVIVFTHLGKGDAKLMLAATPLLLITQMLLLPLYIWLLIGKKFLVTLSIVPFVESFTFLLVLPFITALLMQKISSKNTALNALHKISDWLPVPFMALVLLIIIASQITELLNHQQLLLKIIPIYVAFMVVMLPLNIMMGKFFRLQSEAKRTLIYSAGTRNSLAVLPFVLALPKEMAIVATIIIVTQTIIELMGELIYVKITPKIH